MELLRLPDPKQQEHAKTTIQKEGGKSGDAPGAPIELKRFPGDRKPTKLYPQSYRNDKTHITTYSKLRDF